MLYINYYDWLANCQIGNCNDDLEKEISGFCNEVGQTKSSQIKNEQHLVELNEAFSLSDSLSLSVSLSLSLCLSFSFLLGQDLKEKKDEKDKMTEAAVRRCSSKYIPLKKSQYSRENICVGVSFLTNMQALCRYAALWKHQKTFRRPCDLTAIIFLLFEDFLN